MLDILRRGPEIVAAEDLNIIQIVNQTGHTESQTLENRAEYLDFRIKVETNEPVIMAADQYKRLRLVWANNLPYPSHIPESELQSQPPFIEGPEGMESLLDAAFILRGREKGMTIVFPDFTAPLEPIRGVHLMHQNAAKFSSLAEVHPSSPELVRARKMAWDHMIQRKGSGRR